MVLVICPMLAGDAILGGLRGENRRIEDKFDQMNMEMKLVQILLDLSGQQGNRPGVGLEDFFAFLWRVVCIACFVFKEWLHRTMPQSLSAWMVVLDKTLGSRQGTLFKAPRGSERELKDANTFCRNDFWALVACKPSQPLQPGMVAKNLCIYLWFMFTIPQETT